MYRSCPNCRKHIYIDLIQSKSEEDGKALPTGGTFSMQCPNCSGAVTFNITLMSEQEYVEFSAKMATDREKALEDLYQDFEAFADQPKKTTAALEYDKVEDINFKGSCICFTGKFSNTHITREKLTLSCEFLGATMSDSLTNDVNILIVGSKTSAGWIGGNYGRKIEKALLRRAETKDILILSEENFIEILKRHEHEIEDHR